MSWPDLLRSRKSHVSNVPDWTQRILPDGFSFSLFIHTAAERLADFASSFVAVCARAHRLPVDLFHAVSLVLRGRLSGAALRAHVLRDGGLSPLFFASLVQDQPRVSIRDRLHGHDFFAEGRALVGGASPAPSPAFGPGTGSAFAHAFRLFLVACRLDYLGQVQRHAHRIHRGLREVSRAALAEQVPLDPAGSACCGAVADRRMAAVYLGLLPEHRAPLARYLHHQFALAPLRFTPL